MGSSLQNTFSLLQIVECFPHTMPKELPLLLPKIKWTKTAQEVDTWEVWWEMHEKILKLLKKQAKHIHNWWEFTGKPDPGIDAIVDCLKRLVTSVLTHPVTIGNIELVDLTYSYSLIGKLSNRENGGLAHKKAEEKPS